MAECLRIQSAHSILSFSANEWNHLAGDNPALAHEYLSALERSACASRATGWGMQFLLATQEGALVGAMPLYFKMNSYGEFVFDWAWADAYRRNGLQYYPKLVCAVPFTPICGQRILSSSVEVRGQLVRAALHLAQESGASSFHCLFPIKSQAEEMAGEGMMIRQDIQFHWQNKGYRDFAEFLSEMRHDKRKKILQERRKLQEAGITFERIPGRCLTEADWEFFYECYVHTHRLYNSPIPLSLDFFLEIGRTMPGRILLILGSRGGKRIASALDLADAAHLYGRSWGALEYHPGLHFEVCYYQSIEHCIENRLGTFEGGAQGEHKLARGFLPVSTYSAHWLAHPEFSKAVENFLQEEAHGMAEYANELAGRRPFKLLPKE